VADQMWLPPSVARRHLRTLGISEIGTLDECPRGSLIEERRIRIRKPVIGPWILGRIFVYKRSGHRYFHGVRRAGAVIDSGIALFAMLPVYDVRGHPANKHLMDKPTDPHQKVALVRWTMVTLGLLSMVIGGIGVVVPGLPTTIFLILASYFFTRSCPPLDSWMRSSRVFKPYARYLDRREPMPMHAVVWTLLFVWAGIGFSAWRLWASMDPMVLIIGASSLGCIASFSVVWWGRTSVLRAQRIAVERSASVVRSTTDAAR
jgi:uncharacterized protein